MQRINVEINISLSIQSTYKSLRIALKKKATAKSRGNKQQDKNIIYNRIRLQSIHEMRQHQIADHTMDISGIRNCIIAVAGGLRKTKTTN